MTKKRLTAVLIAPLLVLAAAVFMTALTSANVYGQEKSADELAALLKTRFDAEWAAPETIPEKVIACEQRSHKVIVFKTRADWNDPESVVWEWDPAEALPASQAKWFDHVDECKPTLGGSAILVTASSGGAALIRLSDKKILFLGRPGGNTHSIARLPDGNLVTASSTGKYLALFVAPEDVAEKETVETTPVFKKFELPGAHGVVWDAKRKLLWAHGDKLLIGYEYVGTKEEPDLKEVFRLKLTGTQAGGHDLYPAPGYDAIMTTGAGINVFDPEKREFVAAFAIPRIKSVSLSPDGSTLIQRAEEEWWSDTIYFGDSKNTPVGKRDGARFYKARWFVPNTFSEPE